MIDYGVPLTDAECYLAAVSAGAVWLETGSALAAQHRADAAAAERLDLVEAARTRRRSSVALELVAQLGIDGDEAARRTVYERALADFARAGWQKVSVAAGGRHAVCWLRETHAAVDALTLVWGGTSGWGPVYAGMADRLAAHGIVVGLVELPGQGEPRLVHGSTLDIDFPLVVDALLDELTNRLGPQVRFAVLGNSMGGLLAAKTAAALPRVRACVINGGVAQPAEIVRRYPRQAQLWALMLGTGELAPELGRELERLAVDPARDRVPCPVLIFHGGRDPLVGDADVDCFVAAIDPSAAMESLVVGAPDGEHCLYNRSDLRDAVCAEWLSHVLDVPA
jgi:Dipeptidyl aminopeptidases/acylaminoacyl-peptidases